MPSPSHCAAKKHTNPFQRHRACVMRSSSWKSRTRTENSPPQTRRLRRGEGATGRLGEEEPYRWNARIRFSPSVPHPVAFVAPSPRRHLTDIRQPVPRLAAHVIDQAIGLARISSLVEHIVRLAPRDLQNLLVAHDVGDTERGDA